MRRVGRPYVPTVCTSQHGEEINIVTAELRLSTHPCQSTPNNPTDTLEVLAHFEGPNSRNDQGTLMNMVDTATNFPINSPLAAFSRQIEASPELRRLLRDILLERIAICHGTINEECWALGDNAGLQAAILALYRKLQAQ